MFKSILVPIDLADTDLAKPAIATAATLSQTWSGTVRLLNVLPMTPVMFISQLIGPAQIFCRAFLSGRDRADPRAEADTLIACAIRALRPHDRIDKH